MKSVKLIKWKRRSEPKPTHIGCRACGATTTKLPTTCSDYLVTACASCGDAHIEVDHNDDAVASSHGLTNPSWCFYCKVDKLRTDYGYACPKCGRAEFLCDAVPWIENIWLRKGPQHSRLGWLKKRLRDKFIDWNTVEVICGDFQKILRMMEKKDLIGGRNLSRYDYFVMRIISRLNLVGSRGCPIVVSKFRDLRWGKVKDTLDAKLFGIVYPELGWDRGCKCPYFIEWSDGSYVVA